MTFFWCMFDFGKCFGTSLSSHWAGHYRLSYTIHLSSHIMIQLKNGSLLYRIREDDTSERHFIFFIFISSWGTQLPSFLHLSSLLQMLSSIRWSMLSSWATSHVVVRGLALMIALSWLLSVCDGWPLCSSSLRHSSPLQNFWITTAL